MAKQIRILHVTTSLSVNGGVEETLRILCGQLDKKACKTGICSIQDEPHEISEKFKQMGVEVFCGARKGRLFDAFTMFRIREAIAEFKADIVHTHTNKANFHGRLAAALSTPKVSIVTTHHDLGDMLFSKTPGLKKRLSGQFDVQYIQYQNFFHSVFYPFLNIIFNELNSKVITVSNAVKNIYTNNPDDTLFETVYAPYDHTIFKSHYHGFSGKKIVLGTVGRLERQKGHLYLLQAFSDLIKTRDDIFLKIIGDGSLKGNIELFIKRNKLEPYVTLCGDLPHETGLYDDIDIYIQPSIFEGCSITILEAMGMGIPVIASDIGGPRELIVSGKTGLLVPPEDPETLKVAILELIENRGKAFKLGTAGQERAVRSFSSKVFVEKMLHIYKRLAMERRM